MRRPTDLTESEQKKAEKLLDAGFERVQTSYEPATGARCLIAWGNPAQPGRVLRLALDAWRSC